MDWETGGWERGRLDKAVTPGVEMRIDLTADEEHGGTGRPVC